MKKQKVTVEEYLSKLEEQNNAKHTVILDHDGIRRYYPCENAYDAVILMDALCKTYPEVELWKGSILIQKYQAF